jgi:hypothetical protein
MNALIAGVPAPGQVSVSHNALNLEPAACYMYVRDVPLPSSPFITPSAGGRRVRKITMVGVNRNRLQLGGATRAPKKRSALLVSFSPRVSAAAWRCRG